MKMAACEYCHMISVSISVPISDGPKVEAEVFFRFTMAISQFSVDSLSQVTEGSTWSG